MPEFILSLKPSGGRFGSHDSSAAIFKNGKLEFCIEEERLCRSKHAINTFPKESIEKCLESCNIELRDIDKVLTPYKWSLRKHIAPELIKESINQDGFFKRLLGLERAIENQVYWRLFTKKALRDKLSELGNFKGTIEELEHHKCHAASAYYPSDFDNAIIATIDGVGEHHSTVIWKGEQDSIEKVRSYTYPNSLGTFYAAITAYLGYRPLNGEGKIMGLAPYGSESDIENELRSLVKISQDYNVKDLTQGGQEQAVTRLEKKFGRERRRKNESITQFHKDVAHAAQKILEETVIEMIESYTDQLESSKICFAGGVALNCKMTKKVRELDCVDEIYVQPASNDAGLSIGAGFLKNPEAGRLFSNVYKGLSFSRKEITRNLDRNKLDYFEPENLERYIAEKLAEGKLVGWFQGRTEFGPRALGKRSILADPRTEKSRKRINEHVKKREHWRPFAPTVLEDRAEEVFQSYQRAPYMAQTFDVKDKWTERMKAVIHPEDQTSRPQVISEEENQAYYSLISEFEDITGVPAVLNTSFNRSGEPIVNTPDEALRAFYSMGLDILVLEDFVLEK